LIQDDEWFFDTELLVTAQRLGMRISEVPVDWVDDPDSRVKIFHTALGDLRGVWRLSHGRARNSTRRLSALRRSAFDQATADELLRFAGVGLISTLSYLLLFVAWRPVSGTLGANAIALAICTLFNTAVHRELAEDLRWSTHGGRFIALVVGLFLISLTLTTLALATAHVVAPASLALMLLVVTSANAVAAVLRFAVLRAWVFRPLAKG
jgi:putative flippase GtrA